MNDLTRRSLIQTALAAAVAQNIEAASSEDGALGRSSQHHDSDRDALYTRGPIELYTSTLSAVAGEAVTLHVSTVAKRFNIEIARVGLPDEVVWRKEGLPGRLHATPEDAWEKGCRWPASLSIAIPKDWRSGFYMILAVTGDEIVPRTTTFAFVVVRGVQPTAKILVVHPTATYGAYNSYGGGGLYVMRGNVAKGGFIGGERRVSFLRPWMPGFLWKPEGYSFDAELADIVRPDVLDDRDISKKSGITAWANSAGFHNWDRVLIHWLEKNHYAFDCAVSSDLERYPELLQRYRLMLSVWHDEYWSWSMRDHVESFVKQGGNVCFLSGNVALWQIRHEDGGNTMLCYKDVAEQDPLFKTDRKHLTTTFWSSPIVGRPETFLTGLSFFYAGYSGWDGVTLEGPAGYLIYRPDHWVLKDSGLGFGDCLGAASRIVHFEVDGCPIRMDDGRPYPAKDYNGPPSMEILGLCPAAVPELNSEKRAVGERLLGGTAEWKALLNNHGHAVMGLFNNNGIVFSAGTTDWTQGLTGKDPAVEQVTRNLLNRLSG